MFPEIKTIFNIVLKNAIYQSPTMCRLVLRYMEERSLYIINQKKEDLSVL